MVARKKNRDIIIRYTESDTAEVVRDDEVIWSGYMPYEALESLSDILAALDFEVDSVSTDFDDTVEDTEVAEDVNEPSYESGEPDDE